MRHRLLLLLLLLLPTWAAWAQAPAWQSVVTSTATIVRGSAVSASGDYYVVGSYTGTATFGSTTLTSAGGSQDYFVAKLSGSTNAWAWAVSGGGTGTDDARGVAVSGSTVYVTGTYDGSLTVGSSALTSAGGQDVFVAKYTDGGASVTANSALSGGGTGADQGFGIAVNGTNIYVTGFVNTNTTATTNVKFGTVSLGNNGDEDLFVARFTDTGTLAYGGAVSSGGTGVDRGLAIGASSAGVYVTGFFTGTTAVSIGGTSLTGAGGMDVFVAKYTDTGSGLGAGGAVRGGGTANDQGQALTISGTNIYVGGTFNGTASVAGSSLTSASTTLPDIFVAKYADTGSGLSSTFAVRDGGNNTEAVGGILVNNGSVYVAGAYTGTTTLAGTSMASSSDDGFVAKYTDGTSTLAGIGAIHNGATAAGASVSANTTLAVSGSQVFVGGLVVTPATFTSSTTLSANSGSAFAAKLAPNNATVVSITGITPSPTATTQVTYQVVFSGAVTGLGTSNFDLTTTGLSGAAVASVSGSGTTYTVTVNTGTGNGTLRLNVNNSTGTSPTITGLPTTTGTTYNIIRNFQAAPQLVLQGGGSPSGKTDVTAFVDGVQILQSGTSTTVGNALQNGSFETNNLGSSDYLYPATGLVAAPWAFASQSGVARIGGGGFTPPASGLGSFVGFLQSSGGSNGSITQNLAVPTGSYQANLVAKQRSNQAQGAEDQVVTAFLKEGANTVFLGAIQPTATGAYDAFTSATFNVTAPALTATVSTTSGSPTSTSPIPFSVSFSQSVGTTFIASDVTVMGGTLTSGSFSGSGAGPYTFTVTPTGSGTVTVSLVAGVANDANNTQNSASNSLSVQYNQPVTAAPVVAAPANGGFVNTTTPAYTGTAPANSTVTVYVDNAAIGTTTASAGGSWNLTQPAALSQGSHTVYATAQTSGSAVSVNSNTNTFTVDSVRPTVAISSSTAANGGSTGTSPIAYTVTFSETVTGFAVGSLTVGNGTISGFTAVSGTVYTFNVTPSANGAVTVNVAANVAQDAAGNGNTAATQYSITYAQPLVVAAQNVTVQLDASGNGTLNASSVNNGSTGSGTLTYTIQKIARGQVNEGSTLTLTTANGANFTAIRFASYGTPTDAGNGAYRLGSCSAANSVATAQNSFVGRSTGSMDAANGSSANNSPILGDPCGGTPKLLAVQAAYSADAASQTYACSEAGKTQYVLLTVTDGSGNSSTAVATVTVNAPPTATITSVSPSSALRGATITVAGTNLSGIGSTVTVNGASATVSGLSATGFTFVVPTGATAGTGTLTVTAPCSQTLTSTFTVTQLTTAAPVITAPTNNSFTNQAVTISGTAPANSSVVLYVSVNGGAPQATTVTATAAGTFSLGPLSLSDGTYTVYATAQTAGSSVSANSGTITFTVDTVRPTVVLTSSSGASGSTNVPAPFAYTATFSETVTGFVSGDLTLTNGTVANFTPVSGTVYTFNVTPVTPGTVTTVTVAGNSSQDAASNGNVASNTYSLTSPQPVVTVAPATLPNGTVGAAYSQTITASGATAPYSYAITVGALPAGLTLTSGGVLSGTPTAGGSFTFTVTATDASATPGPYSGSLSYTLTIGAPTITVAPAALAGGTFGTAYNQSSTASGGTAPYRYAITAGAVPNGLALSTSGILSGTPTALGSFTFTVTATDASTGSGPYNGSRSYTLTIAEPANVTWSGAISTDWFTAGNWTPAYVPTATVNAAIPTAPSGNRFPVITAGTASARNLTLSSGASLTHTGGTLALAANLTNNGTYQPTGGTANLGSTALSNISGSSNTRFWNLTVGSSGAQSSTSANTSVQQLLTLNGNFTTNSNPLTLESSAAATALVVNNGSNVVNGNVTVQRYIDASGNTGTSGYRHYSSPVTNATVNSLSTSAYGGSFTAQVNAAYNTADPNQLTLATYPNVFGYDESKIAGSPAVSFSDFDKGYQSPASLNTALTVGRGYAVQIGNTEKVQFTGPLNNSTQNITGLTYAAASTSGSASAGWALIGNPYPAPLDWRTVGTATGSSLNGVDGAAYVFQSTSAYAGRYTSYTNNVGAGTGLIASGQGFFVRASTPGTTGSVTLSNANRVTSYANPAFQRPTAETRPLLRLSLALGNQPATVATAQDETFLYFEAGATNGYDGKFDAYKLANPSGYYLGSVTPGSTPLGLSIDGRSPLAAATTTEIPLWVSLPAGTYTLTATELLNFATLAGGTTVQLRDAMLGTLTDLATVPSHSFSVAANAPYAGRFSLVFRTSGVLATVPGTELAQAQTSLYPNPATSATALSVTGLPSAVASVQVEVVDVLGRTVGQYKLPVRSGSAHQSIATEQLASTLYLLRLTALDVQGQVQGTLPTQRLTLSR